MQSTYHRPQIDKAKIARWIQFTHEFSHREFRIALGLLAKGLDKEGIASSRSFARSLYDISDDLRLHERTGESAV